VLGRATIAFWSTDGSAEWLKPWTWFSAARWERMGHTW
jgi:signal peptidase I